MLSLRLVALIALSAALLLVLWPRLAQAEQIERFEIVGWSGGVIADDDGRFSHCRLSAEYYSDITLGFMMSEAGPFVVLGKLGWHLPVGDGRTWSEALSPPCSASAATRA